MAPAVSKEDCCLKAIFNFLCPIPAGWFYKTLICMSLCSRIKDQKQLSPPDGLEPPTFRLTAERASRLRHGGLVDLTVKMSECNKSEALN